MKEDIHFLTPNSKYPPPHAIGILKRIRMPERLTVC